MVDPFALVTALGAPDPFTVVTSLQPSAIGGGSTWLSNQHYNGNKFAGSFGPTKIFTLDYWELRTRSAQLFTENLYARGLIRRLVGDEIGTGLTPELEPATILLDGIDEETADKWSETTEARFEIYAEARRLVDYEGEHTFAELQAAARMESLIEGDVLVVLKEDRRTRLPQVQLIQGERVRSPMKAPPAGTTVVHGVHLDRRGRVLGFYVTRLDEPLETDYLPAYGPRTGKRIAWLVYGTERRTDAVRGTPMLGIVLSSLKELDRFRDSEQRAANANSVVAMWIEKTVAQPGTRPLGGGATRNLSYETTEPDRTFNTSEQYPGIALQELGVGEKPHSFDTKRPSMGYAAFEDAILSSIAWANNVPPEILALRFGNNYSASKAAISEFKGHVSRVRKSFGGAFCQRVLCEWLIAEVLNGQVEAPGLLEAWRDPRKYAEFGAWTRSTWGGPVKPSIELWRDVKAYTQAIEAKLCSRDRASKDMFGQRWSRVAARLAKEEKIIDVLFTVVEPEPVPGMPAVPPQVLPPGTKKAVLALVRGELEDLELDADIDAEPAGGAS